MSTTCPYTPPRASASATRALVSPSSTSEDSKTAETNHYERAAAEAAKSGAMPSTTASSAAAVVGVQKQQSWKMSDLRAQKQGEVVEGRACGQGYSTTQK